MPNLAWTFEDRTVDDLVVLRIKVMEALSTPFRAHVVVLSSNDDLELDDLVGGRARLDLTWGDSATRTFRGICDRLECLHAVTTGHSTYALGLAHDLELLRHRVDHRIFQGQTTREIVSTILREWGIEATWSLEEPHARFDYRTQYGETDLDFVGRLLAADGISYAFRDDDEGVARLVFMDAPESAARSGAPLTYVDHASETHVARTASHVRRTAAVRPGVVALSDFDFRRPSYALAGVGRADGDPARREVFRYRPGRSVVRTGPVDPSTPQADARGSVRADDEVLGGLARRELLRERASRRGVQLSSSAHDVRAGAVIEIVGHPRSDFDGRLLVTASTLGASADEPGSLALRAVFAEDGYEPATPAAAVRVHGLQSAVVSGPEGEEIHTDEFGRIAIRFPWDRATPSGLPTSCWVPVSRAWAGGGYGLFALPRVGHEVLVAFIDGDPDQPVVVGSLHDGAQRTPHRLPEGKTITTLRTSSSPGGEGWNELSFEDKRGHELVHLRAERDLSVVAQETHSVEVGRDWTSSVRGDRSRSVGGSDRTVIAGAARASVGGDRSDDVTGRSTSHVGGARDERIDGSRTLTVVGVSVEKLVSSASTTVGRDHALSVGRHHTLVVGSAAADGRASSSTFIHGRATTTTTRDLVLTSETSIILVCGDSRIELTPDRVIVRGKTVDVDGSDALHARGKGPALHLTDVAEISGDEVKLYSKGASVELDADASVNGSKVRLMRKNGSKSSTEEDDPGEETISLKVRVTMPNGDAHANKKYRLVVAGRKYEGTTSGEGAVAETVPAAATSGHLTVWLGDYPTGPTLVWHLAIGEVPAASSVRGATSRLANLGYRHGAVDEIDDETRDALFAFQQTHGLPMTGELDAGTIARISEDHGS